MSGRSSRSTLIATKLSFTRAAVASSSNDSCAITWHHWQAAYPTDSNTGTSRRRASANASSPHGHQSTGLSACCSRYGLVALFSRLLMKPFFIRNARGLLPARRMASGMGGRREVGLLAGPLARERVPVHGDRDRRCAQDQDRGAGIG